MSLPTGLFFRDIDDEHLPGCKCPPCALPARPNSPVLPPLSTSSMAPYEAGRPVFDSESYVHPEDQMPQIRARAALPHRPRISRLSPVSKYTPSWSSCHSNIGPPAYNTACAWSEEIRTEKNVPGAFPVFSTDNAPLEDTQKENIKPRPYMPIQYMPSHTFEAKPRPMPKLQLI
jgi:hypothetical protein